MSPNISRRELLQAGALGFGSLALAALEAGEGGQASSVGPHFAPQAKSVIFMMQNGGPSQMDLFDPKPELTKFDGKIHAEKVEMFQPGSEGNKLLASPLTFRRYGECGMEMAEIVPHLGACADDICLVRSAYNYHNNHTESLVAINTGKIFQGRPALGSWVSYALGSENRNLPAYIVLRDPDGYNTSGTLLWQNGFMPASYRGTEVSTRGTPVLNLTRAEPLPAGVQGDKPRLSGETQSTSPAAVRRTNRRLRRESRTTNWRPACNWRPMKYSTSPANRNQSNRCTA